MESGELRRRWAWGGVALPLGLGLGVVLLGLPGCDGKSAPSCEESPGALYEKRVAPLLHTDHPNVCAQCHAGGSMDLESFLRPDVCESMACLQAQGLVNLKSPESSVLLSWIERAEPDSELVTQQLIDEERQGFLEWIEHEAACGACADVACPDRDTPRCDADATLPSPFVPENDPGNCERETLERLFRGTVYEWRGRCYPCHFQEQEGNRLAPRWATELGTCEVAALFTQQTIVDSGYIDVDDPEQSLLLLKPLAVDEGGAGHGGNDKFTTHDQAYTAFLYWATRYAECSK